MSGNHSVNGSSGNHSVNGSSGNHSVNGSSGNHSVHGSFRVSLVGAGRMVETSWFEYRQTWRGSVFSAFLGPLLYLGAIGFGLGSLVDADAADLGRTTGTLDYVTYLAPGLIAATAMQVGSNEAIFGTMAAVRWRRTWFTAVSTPLEPGDMAVGHLVWCGARALLAAASYGIVTVLFGILTPLQALSTLAPVTLGAMALCGLLMAWLVVAQNEHSMNAANRFIVIPMFLFSGVFFPIDQLPGWMQPIAQATPLWHAVELSRRTALGEPTTLASSTHVLVLVGVVAGGLLLSLRNFPRRLAV